MPHNFIRGINWATDPTGETVQASRFFVAKHGNNVNAGTPNAPYLNPMDIASFNGICVFGPGRYVSSDIAVTSLIVVGDGNVLIDSHNPAKVAFGANGGGSVTYYPADPPSDFFTYIRGFDTLTGYRGVSLTKAFLIDMPYTSRLGVNASTYLDTVFFDSGCNIKSDNGGCVFERLILHGNSKFGGGDIGTRNMHGTCKDSHIGPNVQIRFSSATSKMIFTNCNIQSTYIYDVNTSTLYTSLEQATAALPNQFINCINVDPKFVDPDNYNFDLKADSLLIGAGSTGGNITGMKVGRKITGLDQAISGGTLSNISIDNNGILTLTDPLLNEGYVETLPIDFGGVQEIRNIKLNIFTNFVDNIPDNDNKLINTRGPNLFDYEMKWANNSVDLIGASYKPFRWNTRPCFDGVGKYNAEVGYVGDEINSISARFVQLKIYLRNNWTA